MQTLLKTGEQAASHVAYALSNIVFSYGATANDTLSQFLKKQALDNVVNAYGESTQVYNMDVKPGAGGYANQGFRVSIDSEENMYAIFSNVCWHNLMWLVVRPLSSHRHTGPFSVQRPRERLAAFVHSRRTCRTSSRLSTSWLSHASRSFSTSIHLELTATWWQLLTTRASRHCRMPGWWFSARTLSKCVQSAFGLVFRLPLQRLASCE